jgi:hypothetical protein
MVGDGKGIKRAASRIKEGESMTVVEKKEWLMPRELC